jgi:subtilisin family serine protease
MEATGKILLFVAMIVATARSDHEIYGEEGAGQLQSYIVHMDPTKVQIPDSMNPATWYASLIHDAVVKAGALNDKELTESNILYAYDTVLTGFAAKLNRKQVAVMKAMEGFMGAYPDDILKLHTTYTPQFLGLKRGHGLWSKYSNSAADVIIGLLDTGVWPEHPSFADHKTQTPVPSKWKGDCEVGRAFNASLCNKKLIGARFFYKGYESAFGPINETLEYKSPRDSNGHGTHTASTAAGNAVPGANVVGYAKGLASGMAPGARVAVYKVCWLPGCFPSDILKGMEKAVSDGVDVMSISIGGGASGTPFYIDNAAVGAFGAVARGVFVSCSAGNSGPYASSTFNGAPWMMTVGASSVDRSFPASVVLGNGKAYRGASLYSGKPLGAKPNLTLVYGETAGRQGAAQCLQGFLEPKLVHGKIVVCEEGVTDNTVKGRVVAMAGGIGMIDLNAENDENNFIPIRIFCPLH